MHNEILNLLADLDLETLSCDPETVEGRARLREIENEMWHLESQLAELNHMEWLETTWG